MHEFVSALKSWRPHVVLQFEDFGALFCCAQDTLIAMV